MEEGNYVSSHMTVRLRLNNDKFLSYCMLILNCAVVARTVARAVARPIARAVARTVARAVARTEHAR